MSEATVTMTLAEYAALHKRPDTVPRPIWQAACSLAKTFCAERDKVQAELTAAREEIARLGGVLDKQVAYVAEKANEVIALRAEVKALRRLHAAESRL